MIELAQIQFAYAGTQVLRGIDLVQGPGEVIAIIGPNGAGKSTLLRIVAGLLRPSAGTAKVFGIAPDGQDRGKLAQRMAYLSQSYRMAFPFTALEVVSMGRYAHNRRGLLRLDRSDDRERAMAALARCEVDDLAHRRLDELSGGEKRRVLIAQALCQEAELLLLDEPSAGLDPRHARDLFSMLRNECASQRAVLVVTHDLNLAARYADRLLLLHAGAQVALGPAEQVLASSAMEEAFAMRLHRGLLPDGTTPYVVPS